MTMRRKALRQPKMQASQVAKPVNWLAPVGGWRADKPLETLPPDAAASLVNFFPEAGYIRPRNGSNNWATGMSGSVGSLMAYFGATSKMFAVSGGNIYDVTSAGAVGAAVQTGLTNNNFSWTPFVNSGGNWLIACNGVDGTLSYNGSSWAGAGITGNTTGKQLLAVASFQERLYFLEKGTSLLWFLPTLAITGALAGSINLGAVFRFGGVPVDIGVWTCQTVAGPQLMLCIMSSEGEVIIYTGTDPTTSTAWSLLGSFKLGFPLGGNKCFYPIGGDLAVMTVDGIVPISKAIALDPSATDQSALTGPIAPVWLQTVQSVGRNTSGWQLTIYPSRRMAIINIPDPIKGAYQYVMNTETQAWTQFVGMPATVWLAWEGGLYFGTASGTIVQADIGASDNGSPIDCLSVGAWQRLGDGLGPKVSTLIGVDAIADITTSLYAGASWDYVVAIPASVAQAGISIAQIPQVLSQGVWDVSQWDDAVWSGAAPARSRHIADASGAGVVFAPTIRALVSGSSSQTSNCQILGGAIHIMQGGGI